MRRFTSLFQELDGTTRTSEKVRALQRYFAEAPALDAAWALHVLLGRRIKRAAQGRLLRSWVAEEASLPLWMVEDSYHHVGDLAETLALLFPRREAVHDLPLHRVLEEWVVPLPERSDDERRELVIGALSGFDASERFVFLKLITGAFRVGVGPKLVTRALAQVAGVDPATMALRVAGAWEPTAEAFHQLMAEVTAQDPARPYPFFLAHPLDAGPEGLGDRSGWSVEWKWDGIRLQLIRRGGRTLLWSRGEELVTHQFPEVVDAAQALPDGTVLDGEALAWRDGRALAFGELQRRLGRKRVGPRIRAAVPVAFVAFDLLEDQGRDVRARPLRERRSRLEAIVHEARSSRVEALEALHLSSLVEAADWKEVAALRASARSRGVEGLMLKARDSEYGVGRPRGSWWKWKVDPFRIDAVLLYAQAGHGRRAGLFTDYTFGVWDGEELVTVGKAYSGLADEEIRRLDRWIRRHTVERFGPVRSVERTHVFELAFDGIRPSGRHRSGVALRFPRIARWREDKRPEEADTLESVHRLMDAFADG